MRAERLVHVACRGLERFPGGGRRRAAPPSIRSRSVGPGPRGQARARQQASQVGGALLLLDLRDHDLGDEVEQRVHLPGADAERVHLGDRELLFRCAGRGRRVARQVARASAAAEAGSAGATAAAARPRRTGRKPGLAAGLAFRERAQAGLQLAPSRAPRQSGSDACSARNLIVSSASKTRSLMSGVYSSPPSRTRDEDVLEPVRDVGDRRRGPPCGSSP